jgi:tetratricopeptide (TPR) repeat protein
MTKPGSQRNPTIESLKDRIARDPLSRAFLQLAEEYRKEGRYQEAIDVCLEGLQRHPTYHTARISLGRTYMEGGDLENARRAFVEVLELQPENHLAAKLLAEIQRKMGDPAGAAATYRSILRYYPNDREVATLLDETLRQGSVSAAPVLSATIGAPTSPTIRPASSARAVPASSRQAPASPAPPASLLPAPARGPADRPADPSPDFRPEDFGGAAIAPARDAWSAPAAGAPPAWSGPPSDSVGGPPDDDALQTNTLAELYLRQGLVDRAIEVYRGMLRVDPGNQKAARRLNELAPAGGPSPVMAVEPAVPPRTPSTAPAAPVRSDGDARRDTIRRLERWLANFSGAAAKGAPLR